MQEFYRTAKRVLEATKREGTATDVCDRVNRSRNDPISRSAIRRHLAGLICLGLVEKRPGEKNSVAVFFYKLKEKIK